MQTPKIYTVATAHLDTSWHWTLETTIEEYLPKTLLENFELFEKYPDYTFSFEGAYRYELMEEYYPELFEKLKGYIEQGRWHVAGSGWENGDVNTPSPEALLRNFLLGNQYFQEKFGKQSCDIYLPDCFGFGRALPGIAAHVGLKGFSTQKLVWGSAGRVPFAIGRWQAPDGSEIFACPDVHNYTASLKKVRGNYFVKRGLAMQRRRKLPPLAVILHGVGDMGGAPKEPSVKVVCDEMARNGEEQSQVLSTSTDQVFRDIYDMPQEVRAQFPVYKGEWLLSDHAAGCYTARTFSKRWNRQAEQLAYAAEAASCFAGFVGRMDYPGERLNDTWKRVIVHQFHDDMTGTSDEISYRRNWDDLMSAQQQFAGIYTQGVSAIANAMNTSFAQGRCLAVCNPTQWERREAVAIEHNSSARVLDTKGNVLPTQHSDEQIVFMATLPPFSVTLYDVQAGACATNTGLRASENSLENKHLAVKLDQNGDICSLYDKRNRRESLRAPVRLAMLRCDGSPVWPAWELYYPELKRKAAYASNPRIRLLERGPARAAIEVTRTHNGSTFRQVISLDAEGQAVRVHNDIDWQSPRSLLKVEIPCAAQNKLATYDIGFGVVQRGNNTKRQYEVPAQQWADLTDQSGAFGLTVLSDSKTGWDKPNNHTLRLTAVYTPKRGHRGDSHVLDFGRSSFDFGLCPHNGAWDAKHGACFGQPPAAFWPQENSQGPDHLQFGTIEGNAIVRALKCAEDGKGWVARVQETRGEPANAALRFGNGIVSFSEIDGAEQPCETKHEATLDDGTLNLKLGPFQLRSFLFEVKSDQDCAPAQLTPLDLPSKKESLLPEPILRCNGQEIALPKGKELRLAVASFGDDREAVFRLDNRPLNVKVYDAQAPVGAGDLYRLGLSGYVKPAMSVREFSHTCGEDGKPQIGKQARFYALNLPLKGASKLTLPQDENIVLLSAAVAGEQLALPASALFDRMEAIEITPAPAPPKAKMILRGIRHSIRFGWNAMRVRRQIDFGL